MSRHSRIAIVIRPGRVQRCLTLQYADHILNNAVHSGQARKGACPDVRGQERVGGLHQGVLGGEGFRLDDVQSGSREPPIRQRLG